jgi:hypothetical protein
MRMSCKCVTNWLEYQHLLLQRSPAPHSDDKYRRHLLQPVHGARQHGCIIITPLLLNVRLVGAADKSSWFIAESAIVSSLRFHTDLPRQLLQSQSLEHYRTRLHPYF